MSQELQLSRLAILRALLSEAHSGEPMSDTIRVADYVECMTFETAVAPKWARKLSGLGVVNGVAPTVGDVAKLLLAHIRGERPWPRTSKPKEN